jgi:hypothetical protein
LVPWTLAVNLAEPPTQIVAGCATTVTTGGGPTVTTALPVKPAAWAAQPSPVSAITV